MSSEIKFIKNAEYEVSLTPLHIQIDVLPEEETETYLFNGSLICRDSSGYELLRSEVNNLAVDELDNQSLLKESLYYTHNKLKTERSEYRQHGKEKRRRRERGVAAMYGISGAILGSAITVAAVVEESRNFPTVAFIGIVSAMGVSTANFARKTQELNANFEKFEVETSIIISGEVALLEELIDKDFSIVDGTEEN